MMGKLQEAHQLASSSVADRKSPPSEPCEASDAPRMNKTSDYEAPSSNNCANSTSAQEEPRPCAMLGGQRLDCPVCLNEITEDIMVFGGCGHSFCNKCAPKLVLERGECAVRVARVFVGKFICKSERAARRQIASFYWVEYNSNWWIFSITLLANSCVVDKFKTQTLVVHVPWLFDTSISLGLVILYAGLPHKGWFQTSASCGCHKQLYAVSPMRSFCRGGTTGCTLVLQEVACIAPYVIGMTIRMSLICIRSNMAHQLFVVVDLI